MGQNALHLAKRNRGKKDQQQLHYSTEATAWEKQWAGRTAWKGIQSCLTHAPSCLRKRETRGSSAGTGVPASVGVTEGLGVRYRKSSPVQRQRDGGWVWLTMRTTPK